MLKKIFILIFLLSFNLLKAMPDSTGAHVSKVPHKHETYFGIGAGLPYGGFGINIKYYPGEQFGVFAGAGTAIVGLGWNVGINVRPLGQSMVAPYITMMYGYNLAVRNGYGSDELYYGPSLGGGIEIYLNRRQATHFQLGIIYPIRSSVAVSIAKASDFYSPVLISLGIHF